MSDLQKIIENKVTNGLGYERLGGIDLQDHLFNMNLKVSYSEPQDPRNHFKVLGIYLRDDWGKRILDYAGEIEAALRDKKQGVSPALEEAFELLTVRPLSSRCLSSKGRDMITYIIT